MPIRATDTIVGAAPGAATGVLSFAGCTWVVRCDQRESGRVSGGVALEERR
jgi:hypothetical protein